MNDKSEYRRALEKYEKEVENDNRIREKILKMYSQQFILTHYGLDMIKQKEISIISETIMTILRK